MSSEHAASHQAGEVAIRVAGVAKGFESYRQPADRLKRSLYSLLARLAPLPALRRHWRARAQDSVRMFWALREVDFEVARGETIGIIGRNGSGKSTLLQIVCGTLAPSQGEVRTQGRIAALLELGSGFDIEYSGRENIYINAQLHGLSRDEITARLDAIIAFADIGEFIDQPVKTYSSGMFVRLAFAVIAHVDADILVIDEALAVGDAFFTQKCMRFLRGFQQHGTVLFVSHDSAAVRSLCDRAIWLDRGRLRESGSSKTVCTHYFEAYYRQQQGDGVAWGERVRHARRERGDLRARPAVDQREAFPSATAPVMPRLGGVGIDPQALPAARERALIEEVALLGAAGAPLAWITGGEAVTLRITLRDPGGPKPPCAGFIVKDRLGQAIFGDDTAFSPPTGAVAAGGAWRAEFRFAMPLLPPGDYAVTAYVLGADGATSRVVDCLHDACIVRSESAHLAAGLAGTPMTRITLSVGEPADEA
ncbi:ABC transporter ATP-binding protein [Burkholderia glumae]|uniref:ABC transporter ATP-binding protein n=2 Tax=Burkholderia glumae TaxID=337 RepID=A0AAP9Y6H3_BURGL|nr:ABC transporter ATP-binding protein [Burkholderia glumae]ACR27924.1 Putative lipopolysaccharide ABC transporter, ATP-binding protein [Burkholderia glumae BGR1]AJY67535.1 ABC transporter family protein [Burkholderia glumae LMG 2196 = ATCC 33617]KHJ62912.1 ABC transporter ATP-binding protein [Burkholderia glumae]MCM2481098.1 ABC transporter ATP-binding protein [Burkholderia glumae]MCM2508763.1 ABC transporter ATP-binding protein [Burkholderia glumae]